MQDVLRHLRELGFPALCVLALSGCTGGQRLGETTDPMLYYDSFTKGLTQWQVEAEGDARVTAFDGRLTVVAPGGATIWFRPELRAPVEISYTITAIDEGGPHDRVSDLNQFWMARDPHGADMLENAPQRSGKFAEYDALELYYVGVGGHNNTRTRFRRYVGRAGDRPLLPEHDLVDAQHLIEANRTYRIRIVSEGRRQRFYRDGELIYDIADDAPYLAGHFAFRTVRNHLIVEDFAVRKIRSMP